MTEQKAPEPKTGSVANGATIDAKVIQNLGIYVEDLVQVFECTVTVIRKEPYVEQEGILAGRRKLLEEQLKEVNTRLILAMRLKPGA